MFFILSLLTLIKPVELNSIYLRYRNYQPKTNNIYDNYSLTYLQLWKLLEDCEISKLTNYTLGN